MVVLPVPAPLSSAAAALTVLFQKLSVTVPPVLSPTRPPAVPPKLAAATSAPLA